jgi:4-amino-4-deoxy-L-arabinose transferase-like glycosyltransferase
MAKIFSKSKVILIVILLLASFLRLYKLTVNPVSLFGDELDLGYQAYSILKTGEDYYGNFLPIHFHSLAEWRTPLYLYSTVPTVAIWGITPLGVRVPAAIFGILGVLAIYLLVKEITKNEGMGLISAGILAISPWHLQYSRAGFEATQLLFFLLIGLWLFFKVINSKDGKYLWVSVVCLVLTPWVYSTAKLFTPLLLIFLCLVWRKEIFSFNKKHLICSAVAGLVVGVPIIYSTLFGGGTARFDYLSVFTDPTVVGSVGEARLEDARVRGQLVPGISPLFLDKIFHNKYLVWGKTIAENALQPFSSEFLFIKGDPNPRQSIGIGEFYKIDAIFLVLGTILFFTNYKDVKIRKFLLFWLLVGIIPAAITRDGGNHATRLFLILPPLVFLITYGLLETYRKFRGKKRAIFIALYLLVLMSSFFLYEHNYRVHYPFASERWWHAGFKESFGYIKTVENQYDRVFISMAGEPAWIFFAGYYQYPPQKWHENFPFKTTWVDGFGRISYVDKYYFGSPALENESIYDLPKFISSKDIYLAVAKEVAPNLIMNPGSIPNGLKLLKAIPYPSGEPAYYIFTKNQ